MIQIELSTTDLRNMVRQHLNDYYPEILSRCEDLKDEDVIFEGQLYDTEFSLYDGATAKVILNES